MGIATDRCVGPADCRSLMVGIDGVCIFCRSAVDRMVASPVVRYKTVAVGLWWVANTAVRLNVSGLPVCEIGDGAARFRCEVREMSGPRPGRDIAASRRRV